MLMLNATFRRYLPHSFVHRIADHSNLV